jgi:hypothetical protein
MISVLSSNNLLRPITDFLANSTRLKTPYLTALSSTSLFTTIPSTKYTMVLFLKEERAKKKKNKIREFNNSIT